MWSKKASKAGGGKRFGLVKKQGSNSVPAIFGGGADDDAPADARGAMNRRLQAMEASSRKKAKPSDESSGGKSSGGSGVFGGLFGGWSTKK